jgi:micrococcal nuclease
MINKSTYFYYSGISLFFLISLYFTISIILFQTEIKKSESDFTVNSGDTAKVTRIIDGDELAVQVKDMKFVVRILGISSFDAMADDPATQNIGKSAFNYLKSQLENNNIILVFDEFKKDNKNRLLSYIYLNNKDIGNELISNGLVLLYNKFDFSRIKEYSATEDSAKKEKIGLWSDEDLKRRSLLLKEVWEKEKNGKD